MKSNSLNLVERVTAPTPKWFKIIRNIGIVLTAVGGAILAVPVAIPATIVTVAGYVMLGGTVATAIAQRQCRPTMRVSPKQKRKIKQLKNLSR